MVPGATTANIAGFVFAPGGLTVARGKAITWLNTDQSPHQITVQGTNLKTGFLLKGQRATLTFPSEGVFSYNCALEEGTPRRPGGQVSSRTPRASGYLRLAAKWARVRVQASAAAALS